MNKGNAKAMDMQNFLMKMKQNWDFKNSKKTRFCMEEKLVANQLKIGKNITKKMIKI